MAMAMAMAMTCVRGDGFRIFGPRWFSYLLDAEGFRRYLLDPEGFHLDLELGSKRFSYLLRTMHT